MEAELQASDPPRIGPYRLVAVLGSGGMGRVYLGRSAGGREVAVKVIRAELAADPEFRTRFRREVAAARLVNGLYTAAVVDADTEGLVPWLATAYINAPSLGDAVQHGGPLQSAALRALASGLAEGLSAIHAAGVVHRDLKPTNVLLAADGPRVIDFGIASAAEATSLTGTDVVIGSPGYLSPEQAEANQVVGPATDIFALGTVLCFAATGRSPWGTGSAAARIYRVVHGEPEIAGVPDEIRPLVARCMAKSPRQRPTAGDILAELGDPGPVNGWLPRGSLGEASGPAQPSMAAALPSGPSGASGASGASATWGASPASSGPGAAAAVMVDRTAGPGRPFGVPTDNLMRGGGAPALDDYPPGPRTHARPRVSRRRRRLTLLASAAVAAGVLVPVIVTQAQSRPEGKGPAPAVTPAAPALAGAYSGAKYGFNSPTSIAADSGHVWVLNGSSTVTELDARTGAYVQTLKAGGYGFNETTGIIDDGTNVWAGNLDSVTEINAGSGSPVRVLRIPASVNIHGWPTTMVLAGTQLWGATPETCRPYCGPDSAIYPSLLEFNASSGGYERVLTKNTLQDPISLASDGTHVWFAASTGSTDSTGSSTGSTDSSNDSAGIVTEIDASDGHQIWSVPATIYNQQKDQTAADPMAYANGKLWVATGHSVTELNASNGKLIRVLSGEQYHFSEEPAIAVAGSDVFVVNSGGNSVTEIDASTGVPVHTLTAAGYHLDNPVGIAVVGSRAWILNAPFSGASSVVEISLSAG